MRRSVSKSVVCHHLHDIRARSADWFSSLNQLGVKAQHLFIITSIEYKQLKTSKNIRFLHQCDGYFSGCFTLVEPGLQLNFYCFHA